jgi:hypothetical protein
MKRRCLEKEKLCESNVGVANGRGGGRGSRERAVAAAMDCCICQRQALHGGAKEASDDRAGVVGVQGPLMATR